MTDNIFEGKKPLGGISCRKPEKKASTSRPTRKRQP